MRGPGPRVGAGDAERRERCGEAFEILHRHVERRLVERPEADWLMEVEPYAAGVRPVECDVAVTNTAAHADGGDPVPWTLDPPTGDVTEGRRDAEESEAGIEFRPDVDVRVLAADAEQQQDGSRPAADPDREAPDRGVSGDCSRADN